MKLLLDTHVWLWALHAPLRLNPRVRAELRNPANELWLSPISTWLALLLNARVGFAYPPIWQKPNRLYAGIIVL